MRTIAAITAAAKQYPMSRMKRATVPSRHHQITDDETIANWFAPKASN
ncbi:hypothetical protein [Rhodopirellula sp. MGV]|nr:hypothetical protein [Rhodopirellula sp. MGV]